MQALDGSQLAFVSFTPEEIENTLAKVTAAAQIVSSELSSENTDDEDDEETDE